MNQTLTNTEKGYNINGVQLLLVLSICINFEIAFLKYENCKMLAC